MTKGSAPSLNVTVNPATNRITNAGMSYDAKGNLTAMPGLTMTYDPDNRMISNSSGDTYLYDAAGQRARRKNGATQRLYFYGVDGNLLNNWPNGYNVYSNSPRWPTMAAIFLSLYAALAGTVRSLTTGKPLAQSTSTAILVVELTRRPAC